MLDVLRDAAERGAWVAGFCAGVFTLGYAGLLDGRRCTVHWVYEPEFRALFPTASVDPQALYMDDGGILTSAGTVAAVDLCLHLVRRLRGVAAATTLARRMVAAPHRAGGQAQFVQAPVPATAAADDAVVAEALEWVERRLDQPFTVAELARRSGLGERTFLRRFSAATGTTPAPLADGAAAGPGSGAAGGGPAVGGGHRDGVRVRVSGGAAAPVHPAARHEPVVLPDGFPGLNTELAAAPKRGGQSGNSQVSPGATGPCGTRTPGRRW